ACAAISSALFGNAFAGDATWNGVTGSWNNSANWTSVPSGNFPDNGQGGDNDWTANVGSGNAQLDTTSIDINQLNFSGGTISGFQDLTLELALTWTGGTFSDSGTMTVSGIGTNEISGGAHTLDNLTFVNSGT